MKNQKPKYVINGLEGNNLHDFAMQLCKEDNGYLADICIAVLAQLRADARACDVLIAMTLRPDEWPAPHKIERLKTK